MRVNTREQKDKNKYNKSKGCCAKRSNGIHDTMIIMEQKHTKKNHLQKNKGMASQNKQGRGVDENAVRLSNKEACQRLTKKVISTKMMTLLNNIKYPPKGWRSARKTKQTH